MGGACHNPNKTNVMTNFKPFPYGYLVAEWLERLTSERVIGGSNPVNGIIFCLAIIAYFLSSSLCTEMADPILKLALHERSPQISLNHVTEL